MLERLSERVGPTGSLQGEGLANLLGRPPFDPLTLALREAGQNIWDARIRPQVDALSIPKMLVRIRTLTASQARVLGRLVESGNEAEDEPLRGNLLRECLADGGPIRVLEICDFGTLGLIGPTDPQSGKGNFVRFFFDIGSAHFDSGDGGTYGYGRSSLYLAGKARTILVDSLISGPSAERRFMGSRIGHSYERTVRGRKVRYTGRHFWGSVPKPGHVEPVTGKAAKTLANALGMPDRVAGMSGTTVLIPWPDIPEEMPGNRVSDVLLHNLWPKLVSSTGSRAMQLVIEQDGEPIPVPDPKKHPAYSLFATSLLKARSRKEKLGAVPIQLHRPVCTTGHIAFERRDRKVRTDSNPSNRPERIFDGSVRHVALMRPSELVVRYMEFPSVGDEFDWGGVFLCSEDVAVTKAFASSEPPAHDDWVPDRLSGTPASLVRVTKNKRIPEAVNQYFDVRPTEGAGVEGIASLAAASDRFAAQFLAGDGSAAGLESGRSGSPAGSSSGSSLKPLSFLGLKMRDGVKVARFGTSVRGTQTIRVVGAATIEGAAGVDELPDGLAPPEVRGWHHPDDTFHAGARCALVPGGEYIMEVEFRGVYAILASCEVVRE